MKTALFCLAFTVVGCATAHNRASDLFARGEYEASAEAYEALLGEQPERKEFRLRRDTARSHALLKQAQAVHDLRTSGRIAEALGAADLLLSRSDAWAPHGEDEVRAAVEREAAWVDQHLRAEVARHLEAREPLGAQALVQRHESLLGRSLLAATRGALTASIQRSGQEGCTRLAPAAAEAPYWSHLVQRYCAHFGAEAPPAPDLPDVYGSLAFSGGVTGVDKAPHSTVLASALTGAFEASPWYAPGAKAAVADLSGSFSAEVKTRTVRRDVPWVENVPYTTFEQVLEPHQVPYTATEYRSEQVPYTAMESYTVQVPYTASESYTYSCGYGTSHRTCTGHRSVTRHRSETRTRTVTKYRSEMRPHMVTKYRTEHRSVSRAVTRYRQAPRVFSYEADQLSADYRTAMTVRLTGALHLETGVEDALSAQGDWHDAQHAPSRVAPERPGFPPSEDWFAARAETLARRLEAELARAWRESFCAPASATLEAASRCLYGHPEAPGLDATFAPVLGGDAPAFIRVVRQTPAP